MKELLKEIRKNKLRIELIEGELRLFSPWEYLDAGLIAEIKRHKEQLTEILSHNSIAHLNYPDGLQDAIGKEINYYPLSSSQKRLWILSQKTEGSIAYNLSGAYIIKGILDREQLAYAFEKLIRRHEILRTVFLENLEKGEIFQIVKKPEVLGFNMIYKDLCSSSDTVQETKRIISLENAKPFDLAEGPLLRAILLCTGKEEYILSCTLHHIISDGWSAGIIMRDLLAFYHTSTSNTPDDLPELKTQYKSYVAWQQRQLQSDSLKRNKNYWLKNLSGDLPLLMMPGDRERRSVKTYNGHKVELVLDESIVKRFKEVLDDKECTLFMGLCAALNFLIYNYTCQNDIIIGTAIAGRNHPALEDQVGSYAETVVLRTHLDENESFNDLLKKTRVMVADAYEHGSYPFDELLKDLNLDRDASRNPLFDIMAIFQNFSTWQGYKEYKNGTGLKIDAYREFDQKASRMDLLFEFVELGERLLLKVEYNTDLYDHQTVINFANQLENMLDKLSNAPDMALREVGFDNLYPEVLYYIVNRSWLNGDRKNTQLNKIYSHFNYRKLLGQQAYEENLTYWQNYLKNYKSASNLLQHLGERTEVNYNLAKTSLHLENDLSQQIHSLCEELNIKEEIFLKTMWGILLGKYNEKKDVVFAELVFDHPLQIEKNKPAQNAFMNILPLHLTWKDDETLKDVLERVKAEVSERKEKSYTYTNDIWTGSGSISKRQFDHVYIDSKTAYQSIEDKNPLTRLHSLIRDIKPGLCIMVVQDNCIRIELEYTVDAFTGAQILLLKERLLKLINSTADNWSKALRMQEISTELLEEEQYQEKSKFDLHLKAKF